MADVLPLKGRVALITGGTSGLGLATAHRLVREGAAVVVTGRDAARGEAAAAELAAAGGQVRFVIARAESRADCDLAVEAALASFGRLDILVANAGIGLKAPLVETTEQDLDRLYAVNIKGYLLAVQAARPALRETRGCVVLISSDAGVIGEQLIGAYSLTKSAEIMMGKLLALDLAAEGIRVNVVCPGDTLPGMRYMVFPGESVRRENTAEWSPPPLGKFGQASDVADAVFFFTRAGHCTGSVLLVDGGSRAGIPAPAGLRR